MHSNHTLLDTTIEGYGIEDFVHSYFHVPNVEMSKVFEDVVLTVQECKYKDISLKAAVEEIREVWGTVIGYIFTAKITEQEKQLVKQMFDDIP